MITLPPIGAPGRISLPGAAPGGCFPSVFRHTGLSPFLVWISDRCHREKVLSGVTASPMLGIRLAPGFRFDVDLFCPRLVFRAVHDSGRVLRFGRRAPAVLFRVRRFGLGSFVSVACGP